jgi:YHS domain-containing protein
MESITGGGENRAKQFIYCEHPSLRTEVDVALTPVRKNEPTIHASLTAERIAVSVRPIQTYGEPIMVTARIALLIGLFTVSLTAAAEKAPVYADGAGAIKGYDPVAYFTSGRPVKGSEKFTHEWNGATWRFANVENRDRFAAAPQKYAPQYGGYCAYGVANGYTVKIEPDAWSIVDGKLYLNYNKSVQATWKSDIPGYIQKANANWPKALEK